MPRGVSWPLLHGGVCAPCVYGAGMCVLPALRLIVVSAVGDLVLEARSLDDGSLVRVIGDGLLFTVGALCATPRPDSVLVANTHYGVVREVDVRTGATIRNLDARSGVTRPMAVDCDGSVIVATDVGDGACRVVVMRWSDGECVCVVALPTAPQTVDHAPVRLLPSRGGALLDGSCCCVVTAAVAVLDAMYVVTTDPHGGATVALRWRCDHAGQRVNDVVDGGDGAILVAVSSPSAVVRVAFDSEHNDSEHDDSEYACGSDGSPCALAPLDDGGLVVRFPTSVTVYRSWRLRLAWLVAVTCALRSSDGA